MAPAYKLTYFEYRGAAEGIRFLLNYGGIEFEDIRLPRISWSENKSIAPFGQLPLLEYNGKTVNQSVAICRYVAKLVKLTGKDDWEDLEIDALVDTLGDIRQKSYGFIRGEESKKAQEKEILLKETFPYYLERFNNSVNNGYLVGGHLTWADLYFVAMMESVVDLLQTDVLENYPNLIAVKNNVVKIPAIKEWMAKRPKDNRPKLIFKK